MRRKTCQFSIRLDEAEKQLLEEIAESKSMSMSDIIRIALEPIKKEYKEEKTRHFLDSLQS